MRNADVLLKFQILCWAKVKVMFKVMNKLALVVIAAFLDNFKPIHFFSISSNMLYELNGFKKTMVTADFFC